MKRLQPGLIALFTCFTIMVQAQINLTNGLIMYYPFTGNATDVSGNTNVATVNGPVLTTDRFGAANSAYYFDGVDDYIQLTGGVGMKPTFPMSISAWVNIRSNVSGVNNVFNNDYVDNEFNGVW